MKAWEATNAEFLRDLESYEYVGEVPVRDRPSIVRDLDAVIEEKAGYRDYWRSVIGRSGPYRGDYKPKAVRNDETERASWKLDDRIRGLHHELAVRDRYDARVERLQVRHRFWVEYAVREGFDVPDRVLDEYPDLRNKVTVRG